MPDAVVAIIADAGETGLTTSGYEAIAFAEALAAESGGELFVAVYALASSPAVAEARTYAPAGLFAPSDHDLSSPDTLLAFASSVSTATSARYVVVSRGPHVLGLAPRLATRLRGSCVSGVTELMFEDGEIRVAAAIYGGAARGVYRFTGAGPTVMTAAPGAWQSPEKGAGPPPSAEVVDVSAADVRVRVVEPAHAAEGGRLEDAPIVVSGGRGLRDAENFKLIRELAAALGGMPGASRAIVDDAWATPAEQVGLTGRVVTPRVYFAIGISGASQHMAGCSNSSVIVAINSDPEAPIFRYAHLGVVGDALQLLPELIREATARELRA